VQHLLPNPPAGWETFPIFDTGNENLIGVTIFRRRWNATLNIQIAATII
jgi:hypothetical protein